MDRGLKYVVEQVDQLEQNLGVQHNQPVPEGGQPASRAPPGIPQSSEHDGPVYSWPAGMGRGPGGSLQWGVP
eukprot:3344659-Prorocentrum_lima.AAC.1